jgi:hypothetical protein
VQVRAALGSLLFTHGVDATVAQHGWCLPHQQQQQQQVGGTPRPRQFQDVHQKRLFQDVRHTRQPLPSVREMVESGGRVALFVELPCSLGPVPGVFFYFGLEPYW